MFTVISMADVTSIVLLLLSFLGAFLSLFAVNSGWAAGSAQPKPSWGQFEPGVRIYVDLGW